MKASSTFRNVKTVIRKGKITMSTLTGLTATAAGANTSALQQKQAEAFMDDAKAKLLSLGNTESSMIQFATEALMSDKYAGLGDDYKMFVIQSLMSLRNRIVSLFTNLISALGENAQRIVQNIR